MRCSLILVVVSVLLLADNATSSIPIAGILEVAVGLVLTNLKRIGELKLTDSDTIVMPENLENIIAGKIDVKDVNLYGFNTLNIDHLKAEDLTASDGMSKINLCLNLTVGEMKFQTQYDADVGIINAVPIYGNGALNLAISKTKVGLCLNINLADDFTQFSVDGLSLLLTFRDSPSSISGFWKNDAVSEVVSLVINILEKFIAMWVTYEEECISCVLSPIVQYIVNDVLNDANEGPIFDCSCLKSSFGKKYKTEDKLKRLITSFHADHKTNTFDNEEIHHFKEMFQIITNNIADLLNQEGVSFDM